MRRKTPSEHRQADSPSIFLFRPFSYWRELCGIGFFIVWHWQILNISLDAKQTFFPGELGDSIHLFFFVSLTFLALFLLGHRVSPFFHRVGRGWQASVATLCMFSLLFSLPVSPPKEYCALNVLALATSGAGSAIMLLAWLQSLAAVPYRSTIAIIGGSFVFSAVMNSFIHFYPSTAMALCVISLSMSRFLLPHAQQPEEALEEKKKGRLPTFFGHQRTENLRLLICAACGICFSAGVFYNLVVFLRPMGEPAPLMLTLLFGIGGLLAIAFLNLPLEKDIYQAFLLVVPFLLCGYVAWPILHGESPGLSLVGMRLGFGLLAVYLFVAVSAMSARLQKNNKKLLYACLGYMSLAFWAGAHVCSLNFLGAYGVQELDILLISLFIVLLSSCGACTFWLYQARYSMQYIEKASQEDDALLDFFASKGLTPQQSVIASLLSKKISENVICDILSISPLTLETHIRNIHKRMNINSRYELMYIGRSNSKNTIRAERDDYSQRNEDSDSS